ncbi:zinc finger protein 891-like [Trichogramma pretiosum]|uniref:zinc finger protein 891-like n=1 Tax=Trichogramma pretiosum TaxID=7493 RepID=UPI0006C9E343|nr:zinc finger protein 891-like [Trichogramma pretiosum]
MDLSEMSNCSVRVKEEPDNMTLAKNQYEITDESPDTKSFQYWSFQRENPTFMLQEYHENSKLIDEIKIELECEDVKPNSNLLPVKKIENYSPHHLQNIKYSKNYESQKTIELETSKVVSKEFCNDDAKQLSTNFDPELNEQNVKKRVKKKLKYQRELERYNDSAQNDKNHACEICGKNYSSKINLKKHVSSVHSDTRYACDKCAKKYKSKTNLRRHVDSAHKNQKPYNCDICGKSFTEKSSVNTHIDSPEQKWYSVRAKIDLQRQLLQMIAMSTINHDVRLIPRESWYSLEYTVKTSKE